MYPKIGGMRSIWTGLICERQIAKPQRMFDRRSPAAAIERPQVPTRCSDVGGWAADSAQGGVAVNWVQASTIHRPTGCPEDGSPGPTPSFKDPTSRPKSSRSQKAARTDHFVVHGERVWLGEIPPAIGPQPSSMATGLATTRQGARQG